MKKLILVLSITTGLFCSALKGQVTADYSKIDIMLVHGEFNRAIDTCRMILTTDSLNAEVYYKMGLAYQNLLLDDKSLDSYLHAYTISPDKNLYKYMVARSYYNKSKNSQARTLLQSLCQADSMNWTYSYYLTSIYMQEGRYDESSNIYKRFYKQDTMNYVLLDKLGFASLRKGDVDNGIDYFSKSLAINDKNINAIKNISYLYAISYKIDTAIVLLTRGIKLDSTDMDLYARRAALYFSKNYNKKSLVDYLRILASGDSSVIYLKRAGIGYTNNLQPKEALVYLLKASKKDTTDFETMDYLARNYHKLNDFKNSELYYNKIVTNLLPFSFRLGLTYILLAEEYKSDGLFREAIANYLKSQDIRKDPSITMIMANLYDEKLNNIPKSIYYYEQFIDQTSRTKTIYPREYVEAIKKRLDFLKEKQNTAKK